MSESDTQDVVRALEALRDEVQAIRYQRGAQIPPTRKYSAADGYAEVRIRLVSGKDPALMSDTERTYFLEIAPSHKIVRNWFASGALRRIKLGKQRAFVTEIECQNLEAAIRQGLVEGYGIDPEHRK